MAELTDILKTLASDGTIAVSVDHTVVDSDITIDVITGATDKSVFLPPIATSKGREITVNKEDVGAGNVIVDGDGAEEINGSLTDTISSQHESKTYVGMASQWRIK